MGAPSDPGRRLLARALRSHWRLLVPSVALLCLWQACEASVPILIGMIVDNAIVPRSVPRIVVGLAVVAVLFTVLSLGYRFGARLANEALNHTTHELRVRLAGHVLDAVSTPARLFLATQPPTSRPLNGIEIDVTAGFGNTGADVPDTLTRAMLMHVALMYELRGAIPSDMQPAAIPAGYDRLVSPYRPARL